jgi:hypothetical protein
MGSLFVPFTPLSFISKIIAVYALFYFSLALNTLYPFYYYINDAPN